MTKVRCQLIFRKRLPGFNSIETLFYGLKPLLNEHIATTALEVPRSEMTLSSIRKNIKAVKRNKAEVNHITGHNNYLALGTGRNTVLTIHDMKSAMTHSKFKNVLVLFFLFWIPACIVKRITVISQATKTEVIKYVPFAKSKIRVIHNPVNPLLKHTPYNFNEARPNILCMGTKKNKNLERIFEAVSQISCHLTILGHLSSAQERLLNQYKISYANHLDLQFEEVVNIYQNCDMLCFPSTYEGFGMPIIEAQAIGRPVITSNYGAMKEVAGNGAYLVDPLDSEVIREGILRIIQTPKTRIDLLEKGLKNVQRFQSDMIAKKYVAVYNEIINS